jgi:hypothetical protein
MKFIIGGNKSMKKIGVTIVICFLLVITPSIVTATSLPTVVNINTHTHNVLSQNGTFDGSIGFRRQGNWTSIGTINGNYVLQNRFGRFNGEWSIQRQNESKTGIMRGRFGKHLLIGRITIDDTNRTLPIIGFIGFRNETFFGRFMSLVGPALYFKGTYT